MKINYETKCRRCGDITAWAGPEMTNRFVPDWKVEMMKMPSTLNCDFCGKETVQDFVSFFEIKT